MTNPEMLSLAEEDRLEELIALNVTIHEDEPVFRNYIQNDPAGNAPSNHRFILKDGKMVASASLFPHVLQWHGATQRAGEIGLVGTLEEHRSKGYCTRLMQSWIEFMQEGAIPLSFLWGIPGFYERYHFYYALPHTGTPYVSFARSCAKGWKATGTFRRATRDDHSRIRELYKAYNIDLTGCEVRSEERWEWYFRLTRDQGSWWVTEDPKGGYAFVAGDPPRVWEITAQSPDSLRNMVLGLFDAYPDLQSLELRHHPDMPIGRWLYHWGAQVASPEDIWMGTWGGMVRINDPLALLQAMTTKLQRRLADSRFFNYTGTIAFDSDVGGATIEISDGEVAVEPLDREGAPHIPARVLTPIMTGYRGFERFRDELKDIPDKIAGVLAVLFPRDLVFVYPLLYANEHFSLSQDGME